MVNGCMESNVVYATITLRPHIIHSVVDDTEPHREIMELFQSHTASKARLNEDPNSPNQHSGL
jgi:hypothetical protein